MKRNMINNLLDAASFLFPFKKIPIQLRIIILQYSDHLQIGHRSIAFVHY